MTRYAPDGAVLATAVSGQSEYMRQDTTLGGPTTGLGEELWWAKGLCVLPDGTLAVTAPNDQTHLVTADLTAVTAHYGASRRRHEDGLSDPFATWISTTPSGRLLCTTGENGVYNYGSLIGNIVSLADQPFAPSTKPSLRALASMEAEPVKHTEADLRPGVLFHGRPVGMDHRPRPSLTEHLTALELTATQYDWHDARLGRPAVVREDLFVVPVYGHIYRGGSRGRRFAFVLVSDEGEFVGQLGGIHLHRDSPFTGLCFEIAADPARERIYRIPCPAMLGDLGQVVEDALRSYVKERTALKKQWQPVNWHWVDGAAPLHRL